MTTILYHATAIGFAILLLMNSAFAQTAPPATKAEITAPVVHTPTPPECIKEADAKGLYGKARKKFRYECKKAAAEKK